MQVTVLGASGKVGRLLVPSLVEAGHDVVGVVRRTEAADEVAAAGARPVLLDLEDETADPAAALSGSDVVVWVAGANIATGQEHSDRVDRDANLRIIAAAAAAGIPRWIQVSSLYADRIEAAPPMLQAFLRNKAVADEALVASDLDWSIVRAAGIADAEATGGFTAVREGMGYGQIHRPDLAAALTYMVSEGAASRRAFDLAGGTAPIGEALAALEG
jgi:uncharacterized protein YbjT (DUF2867 family)